MSASPLLAEDPAKPAAAAQIAHDPSRPAPVCMPSHLDSPYINVDSWVYPAMLRLYSLGFVDMVYLGMRPWTRASVENMLETVGARIQDADDSPVTDEATGIYKALQRELLYDMNGPCLRHQGNSRIESIYSLAALVQKLVPKARVVVGHGQMGETELEKIVQRLFRFFRGTIEQREIDCTFR